jgi:hypothetical protein
MQSMLFIGYAVFLLGTTGSLHILPLALLIATSSLAAITGWRCSRSTLEAPPANRSAWDRWFIRLMRSILNSMMHKRAEMT